MQPKLTIKEYTEALINTRLLGLQCQDCGAVTAPPRMVCRKCCGTNLEVIQLSGKGKIVTFTSIHVPPESRQGQPPWLMANLSGIDTDTASMELIGKRVRMVTPHLPAEKHPPVGVAPLFVLET
jgi:uncharacterized OB-fold protein